MNNLYNQIKLAVDDYNELVNSGRNASIIMDRDTCIFSVDFGISCEHPVINSIVFTTLKTYTGETPPEQNTATVAEIARKAIGEQPERVREWNAKQKDLKTELKRIAETEKAIQQGKQLEMSHPLPTDDIELMESLDEKIARYKAEADKDSQEHGKVILNIGKGIEKAYNKYKEIYNNDGWDK